MNGSVFGVRNQVNKNEFLQLLYYIFIRFVSSNKNMMSHVPAQCIRTQFQMSFLSGLPYTNGAFVLGFFDQDLGVRKHQREPPQESGRLEATERRPTGAGTFAPESSTGQVIASAATKLITQ